ncbi:hypothetical protein L2E82_53563 [Cichorium intybus]|nr:hypothetical protein L2E82_53563 [Cichorium intybus]
MNSHFAPGGTLASVFLFLASGGNSLDRSVLVGLLCTEFTEIDFRYRISGIAFTVRDFRPASPEPASGSLLAKRMLVSLSHDQTNGVKDEKEERGK